MLTLKKSRTQTHKKIVKTTVKTIKIPVEKTLMKTHTQIRPLIMSKPRNLQVPTHSSKFHFVGNSIVLFTLPLRFISGSCDRWCCGWSASSRSTCRYRYLLVYTTETGWHVRCNYLERSDKFIINVFCSVTVHSVGRHPKVHHLRKHHPRGYNPRRTTQGDTTQ